MPSPHSPHPQVISVRENPNLAQTAIGYIQAAWPDVPGVVYEDCISHSLNASGPLPQWYLLLKDDSPIGCAGLIPNDFISRADLWPWLCALFISPGERGNGYASLLIERCKQDCRRLGFSALYLITDHIGLYEKHGFRFLGTGFGVSGQPTRIYEFHLPDGSAR